MINCRFVVEHLKDPTKAFKEFNRVLKPGGYFLLWTVNLLNYAMIISRTTPTIIHNLYRKKLLDMEFNNNPTYYKANTIWKLDKVLRKEGFQQKRLILQGGAYFYLGFSRISYFIGLLLNKFTDFGFLKYFRLYILGLYKKPKTRC
jgi:ubiquinone/menaquinone biosynthesis C-methylase UbiE